jgi:large subunit ribosomal protein L1
MTNLSKRQKVIDGTLEKKGIVPGKTYDAMKAFEIIKECATAKFDESVDISARLGIDTRKSDQTVRGSVVLPHGTGRVVRVAVFAQGANADAATAAGADKVGFEDLAESMKAGNLDFDVVIASPDAMRIVGQLGQVLGPRGLMPNPKVGTVSADVAGAVKNAKGGQVRYRADKAGIVHCTIGKASFEPAKLLDNLRVLLADLNKMKPNTAKGIYLKKVSVSSTMGPGVLLDVSSVGGGAQ